MTCRDALKEEVTRRLEAMKTTWRLLEMIGVQDAAANQTMIDQLRVDDQRVGVFKPDSTKLSPR